MSYRDDDSHEAVRIKVKRVIVKREISQFVKLESGEHVWIPDSQIEADFDENLGSMWITRWFAKEKRIPFE